MSNANANGVHLDLDEDEQAQDTVAASAVGTSVEKVEEDVVDEDVEFDPGDRLPPQARKNADGSITLPLRYPRVLRTRKNGKITERPFAELHLHRLTGADQRACVATSDDKMVIVALARSTRLPQVVMDALFDKMDAADTGAASQVINHFFASGRTTGRRA